jgi:hypothetical protein
MPENELAMEPPTDLVKLSAKHKSCQFSWDSDRTQIIKFMSLERETSIDNSIRVGRINVLDEEELKRYGKGSEKEYFQAFHQNITEADKAKLKKDVKDELSEKSETEKNVGEAIIEMASKFKFQEVQGIGDMASFETRENSNGCSLHVLHKNLIFTVESDISDDVDVNVQMAKKLAMAVLEKCD